MQAGEEGAEEVVQGHNEGVHPLLAVIHLEGGVLIGVLRKWQSWRETEGRGACATEDPGEEGERGMQGWGRCRIEGRDRGKNEC